MIFDPLFEPGRKGRLNLPWTPDVEYRPRVRAKDAKRFALRRVCSAAVFLAWFIARPTDAAPGDLYVADSSSNSIFRYGPEGTASTFASGFYQPTAMGFDDKGNLFVADSGSGYPPYLPSEIIKVTPAGIQTNFAEVLYSQLLGMAFDSSGNLFVATAVDIQKIAPDGTQSTFVPDLDSVWALAFDKLGYLYAAVNASGANSIMQFDPEGHGSTFVTFSGPGQSITAMAFDSSGNLFAQRGDSILRITPAGAQSTFASGFFQSALAFDALGNLFAGVNAYNSSEVGIFRFSPEGTKSDFANGLLFPKALAFEPVTEKLRNISARGLVGTNDDVFIGGFIVGGNGLANNAVVVRAIGPSLSKAGVSNALADPTLELHDSSGALIVSNDDWQDTQEEEIAATGLAPTDPNEAAIYATLPAGNYTAVVRGPGDTTGTALVEIYSTND